MGIRKKILIILGGTLAALFVLVCLFSQTFLIERFNRIEQQETNKDTNRAVEALDNTILDLSTKIHDWSSWDDTYKFIQDKNPGYITSNLNNSSLADLNINLMIFVSSQGAMVMNKYIDIPTAEERPFPDTILPYLVKDSPLLQLPTVDSVQQGIILLPEGPLLITARPITKSDHTGPVRGTVIFGRYLDESIVSHLSKVIHLSLNIEKYDQTLPNDFEKAKSMIATTGSLAVVPLNNDIIAGYSVVRDIAGKPILLLRITEDRAIYRQGEQTIISYLLILGIIGSVTCLFFLLLLQEFIFKRLIKLSSILSTSLDNKQHHIILSGNDEFSRLAQRINEMTDTIGNFYMGLEDKIKEKTAELGQTVKELQKAKAKDEALLESIGDGLIVTDNTGVILLANTAAAKLIGVDVATAMVGKKIFDAFPAYDVKGDIIPMDNRPLQTALQEKKKVQREIIIKRNDDQKLTLSVIATPVIEDGVIIGAIEAIRDITKEKEVDRKKTEFISLASHQLRTPLSAIKWFSEMLVDSDAGTLNQEQLEFAKNISYSTNRMIELINSLLNITRMESGRVLVKPEPTDLKELVEAVIKELEVKFAERKQHLVISMNNQLPRVNVDTRLIRQVYINLLTNAIKYSPKGSEIMVLISRKDDEIISQVSDSGYGIPKAMQTKIFQKFFRADNVAKKETDGTGLGLYLCKSIVESAHGKIWFESEEGKGTTFWFSIPATGMEAKKGEVTLDS